MTPGKDLGYCFPQASIKLNRRFKMVNLLYTNLVAWCGKRTPNDRDMLTWAKTEFGRDWQFAYNHMITHNGEAPRMGIHR
jgi:hypothetical protein